MEPDGFTCPVPCAMAENEVQAEESSVPRPEAKEEVQAKEKFGPCMMCGMEEGGHTSLCVFQEEAKQLSSHFINQVLDSRQGKFLNSGWRTKEFYVPVCKECYKRARRPAQHRQPRTTKMKKFCSKLAWQALKILMSPKLKLQALKSLMRTRSWKRRSA